MTPQCLALDIGNTDTKLALVSDARVETPRRISTSASVSDMRDLLGKAAPDARLTPLAVCSVAPAAAKAWQEAWLAAGGAPPFIVNHQCRFSFVNGYRPGDAIGADRLAACEAAVRKFPLPLAVFNFGTAMAVTVVDQDRRLRGGFIFPGPRLAFDALAARAVQLKDIGPGDWEETFGESTQDNLSRGIYNGFIGAIGQMRRVIERQLKGSVTCVATGGGAGPFARLFDAVDEDLVLRGTFYAWLGRSEK